MSVNYQTLKQQLDMMEKSVDFWYDRQENPTVGDDVEHETVREVSSDLRQWMEEA